MKITFLVKKSLFGNSHLKFLFQGLNLVSTECTGIANELYFLIKAEINKLLHFFASCWINDALRKTTKVKVYNARRTGVKDKIVYIGVGLSVIVVILIVVNIGKNQKKGRQA